MTSERQFHILQLLIKLYSEQQKSISSQMLSNHIKLSPSMLRNELRILEKEGLIAKENFSAGRIPTNKGYEYYIKNTKDSSDDTKTKQVIDKIDELFVKKVISIDEIINEAFSIINESSQSIVFEAKSYQDVYLMDLKIYELSPVRINLVFIFSNGEIHNNLLELETTNNTSNLEQIDDVKRTLNLFASKMIGINVLKINNHLNEISKELGVTLKLVEERFIDATKTLFEKILARKGDVHNFNALINYLDSSEDFLLLKNLLHYLQNGNIFDFLDDKNAINHDNTSIFLDQDTTILANKSLIKKDFNIEGKSKTFYLIGPKSQDYAKIIKILDFIDKKLSEI